MSIRKRNSATVFAGNVLKNITRKWTSMTNKWIMLLLAFVFLSPSYPKTETSTRPKEKCPIGVASFVLSPPIAAAEEQKLTDTLVIAISSDFEPFTFVNAEGKPAGMFVDIWRLWAQKTGKQIEFIISDWKTSLENQKNQKHIHLQIPH